MPVTPKERAHAARMDSDITSVESLGLPILRQAVQSVAASAIANYERSGNARNAIKVIGKSLRPAIYGALVPAMTYSRLVAFRRVISAMSEAGVSASRISFANESDLVKAATRQARRLNISAPYLRKLAEASYGPANAIATSAAVKAEEYIRDVIAESVVQGVHVAEGIEKLSAAFEASGIGLVRTHLVETIFRTSTMLAYAAGEQEILGDPAVADFHWGYKYVTVGDDRVRPTHIALEGATLPKDDPFWARNLPPNGWNCRCRVIPLFDEREQERPASTIRVDGETVRTGADDGFEFNPATLVAA